MISLVLSLPNLIYSLIMLDLKIQFPTIIQHIKHLKINQCIQIILKLIMMIILIIIEYTFGIVS